MKASLYILLRYWRKHKKSAAALMFAGMLMTAVVTASFLMFRASFNRELHALYDAGGMYDLLYPESVEEKISEITERYPDAERAELYTVGKV